MNVYDARWNNAKRYIERVLETAGNTEHLFVAYDGEFLTDGVIEIDEANREINIVSLGCAVNIYNGDPDYDEGAHTLAAEWIAEIKQRLRVFREISIE